MTLIALSRFEVDDAMKEWTFKDVSFFESSLQGYALNVILEQNFFDFIHGRNISAGVSDWDHLMSEMMRLVELKPWPRLEPILS